MKAITYMEYGSPDVLQITEVERPVPKDDEVVISIRAASVNALDRHFMRGEPYLMRMVAGLRKPKVTRLGVDVAGIVETVGGNVTQFRAGDEVFGVCRGAFAEYGCASEIRFVMKPSNVSFEQAAAVPVAAVTALQGLRDKAKIQPGQRILVNGAGGGVGTFAVQIAKVFGADVTAVTSTRNLDMVRSIGADHVVDYTREDFTKNGERYDVIFDLGANHPLSDLTRVLTDDGIWLLVGAVTNGGWLRPLANLSKSLVRARFVSQKVRLVSGRVNKDDLIVLQHFLEEGKITPAIDRCYPLRDVPEAFRYFEEGQVKGKIIITVAIS